ncbi:MAG: hypothetical protein GQ570_11710 [Helicobacteraceae bacterium]|nr:hypothetical protein [Helicobacteraceae bacterium]
MPDLTPQQIIERDELNERVKDLPIITELKAGQSEIMEAIQDDRKQNKEEFARGAEKFAHIQSEVSEMRVQVADGFADLKKDINSHIISSKEDEITKLNKKFEAGQQIKSGIIIALVSGILLTAIGVITNNYITSHQKVQIVK